MTPEEWIAAHPEAVEDVARALVPPTTDADRPHGVTREPLWTYYVDDATAAITSLLASGALASAEAAQSEIDRLTALLERNGARYCLCSRADRMHDRAVERCPHHGKGMQQRINELTAALAASPPPAVVTVDSEALAEERP